MIQLNIGLNNNPYSFEQCSRILNLMFLAESRLDQSKWGEAVEPTVVSKITENWDLSDITTVVERLCVTLEQDAIAIKVNEVGYLVYNPSYVGERYSYNEEYFINY
jgi:hypothetical protein